MGWLSGDALCVVYSHSVWCCMMQKGPSGAGTISPGQEMTAISQDAGDWAFCSALDSCRQR